MEKGEMHTRSTCKPGMCLCMYAASFNQRALSQLIISSLEPWAQSMIALSINASMIYFDGVRKNESLARVSDCCACLCARRQRVRLCTCAVISAFLWVCMSALSYVTMSLCAFSPLCAYAGGNRVHVWACIRVPSGGTEPVLAKWGETCGFA